MYVCFVYMCNIDCVVSRCRCVAYVVCRCVVCSVSVEVDVDIDVDVENRAGRREEEVFGRCPKKVRTPHLGRGETRKEHIKNQFQFLTTENIQMIWRAS